MGNDIVYAMAESSSGRVVFTGDSDSLYLAEGSCPFWEWLGASGSELPRVLTFGANACSDNYHSVPNFSAHEYHAVHLPAEYQNDAAALREDWDVVIYCKPPYFESEDLTAAEVQTLIDYTKVHGGGTLLVSEWFTYLNQDDIDAINLVAQPLGANLLSTNLDWGGADGTIDFDCFPTPE